MPVDVSRLAAAAAATIPSGLVSLYLFGSEHEGRAHRESDVDLGVLLDPRLHATPRDRFEQRLRLIAGLAETTGGRRVDVVVLNDAPPHLVRHVMTSGRRLFGADDQQDRAARRTALSRAADLEPFLRRMRAIKLEALTR